MWFQLWHFGKGKTRETAKRVAVARGWEEGENEQETHRGFLGQWNDFCGIHHGEDVSLHICLNPQNLENSLVAQGLGLGASTAGDTGVIPGQGSKVPWVAWHNRKKKKPTIYNTKSELEGKLQTLGDDASMQVHQWYHVSHSEVGGGGCC